MKFNPAIFKDDYIYLKITNKINNYFTFIKYRSGMIIRSKLSNKGWQTDE